MSDSVYTVTEIVGTSTTSVDDAIRNAVNTAAQSLRHLSWLEVTTIRAQLDDGGVNQFQVGVKIGFRYEKD